ncbi:MAG: putative Ig domain-containing protein [Leptospiraceae bacterium]|nr:putative Ig domain-containing protein [Leptospiraceae bacterium]
MKVKIGIFLSFLLINCKPETSKNDVISNLLYLFYREGQTNLTGTASKGVIRFASVKAVSQRLDGSCNKDDSALVTSNTDINGNYNIRFTKTRNPICAFIIPNSNSFMNDEKLNADIPWTNPNSSLVQILREPNTSSKKLNIFPFGQIGARRISYLLKNNTDINRLNSTVRQVNKELTIRFSLNTGFNVRRQIFTKEVNADNFPESTDIDVNLSSDDPLSIKTKLLLSGFSYLANQTKDSSILTETDIMEVIDAFSRDFEDGIFDGKDINGNTITISGKPSIVFSSNSLSTILLPAIVSFISEGGKVDSNNTVTAAQVNSTIVFNDIAPIVFPSNNLSITNTQSSYVFYTGAPVSISFTTNGTFTNCSTNQTLPVGLSINPNNCAITGTPTSTQASTSYTISASNSNGFTSTTITIRIGSSTAISVFGQQGSFTTNTANNGGVSASSLNQPNEIAFDSTGNRYIADFANHRVLFIPSGNTIATRVYGQLGSFTANTANNGGITANSLNQPRALTLDSNDNLYIADTTNSRVLFYPSGSTTATRVYGQLGSFTSNTANNGGITANSLNQPVGLALDSNNNLYVADTSNHRVLFYPSGSTTATRVYGQLGSFTANTANNGGVSANSLSFPYGVSLDKSGNLYIADTVNNRALFYTSGNTTATRVYGQLGSFTVNTVNNGGVSANSLNGPNSIRIDSNDMVYVGDGGNHRALQFISNSTTAIRVHGQLGSFTANTVNNGGVSANSLNSSYGFYFDKSGNLFITDSGNNRLLGY